MYIKLVGQLDLMRCPHCGVNRPTLTAHPQVFQSHAIIGVKRRFWRIYFCARCGGGVIAASPDETGEVMEIYPLVESIDEAIPDSARTFLNQATDSLHAPAGAVMLCASAVDAMLKKKNYKKGTLNERIDQAAKNQLITEDMRKWAHNIRLDANEPRHADEENPLPDGADARRCLDFAVALAEILFVLPSRVTRGLKDVETKEGE